jgi:hypothetical protein
MGQRWQRMNRSVAIVAAFAALVPILTAAPAAAAVDKSGNVRLVKSFPFQRGGDIAYDGRYVYALERGQEGGLHVYDPRSLREVGWFRCPAYSDVKPLERGLIVFDATAGCGGMTGSGIVILDTRNPKRIRVVGMLQASKHTFRNYPGERVVYLSSNGCCGDGRRGVETIVDASNPAKPEVANEFVSNGLGCHDVWIHNSEERKIAACAAGAETQLWDVSDPLAPVVLSRIPTPQVFFNHSAAISDDGSLLVVGDEAHGLTECAGGPAGDIWAYDISDPETPAYKGAFWLGRGTPVSSFWVDPENEWCSAHNYEFIPGTRILVSGWYAGGMNVIDFTDPADPVEIAHFMAEETSVWGAYWIEGRVWTSDDDRGVDVFEVKGLP